MIVLILCNNTGSATQVSARVVLGFADSSNDPDVTRVETKQACSKGPNGGVSSGM